MKNDNKNGPAEVSNTHANSHGGVRADLHKKFEHADHSSHSVSFTEPQQDPPEMMRSLRESFHRAPPTLRRWATGLMVGAIVLVACIAAYRHIMVAQEAAAREAEIVAGPRVKTVKVTMSKGERTVNLVGEAKPFASVTLYAKVSGYLRDVKVDKGDRVKKGQVLASIDAPETNTSIEGLRADSKNKEMIAKRMEELRAKNLASAQEAEQAESDAAVAKSRFDTMAVQKGEQFLRAPFDGTVTARYADPGALVQSAMNSQTSSLPVLSIAQTEQLRVYIYVDQRDATFIIPGRPVKIHLTERPDVEIKAAVTRISGELDPQTRMLLTEIDVENKDGLLVAGSFVQVALSLATPALLEVPSEALVPGKETPTIPVVSEDNHLHFAEVKVAGTDGKFVQVASGLKEGQVIALNVGSTIAEGSKVRPVIAEAAPPKAAAEAAPPKAAAVPLPKSANEVTTAKATTETAAVQAEPANGEKAVAK